MTEEENKEAGERWMNFMGKALGVKFEWDDPVNCRGIKVAECSGEQEDET